MVDFSRISGSIRIRGRVERSLRKTFARAVALFSGDSEEPADEVELARRRAFLSLVRTVLESRKPMGEAEIDLFRRLLSEDFSPFKIERMISDLGRAPITTAEEAAPLFQAQPEEDRERLIRLLLILAAGSDCLEESSPLIDDLAARFGFSGELISRMRDEVVEAQRRRMRILRSGAGVLVALIVIAVFILTATLLRSVIFGLKSTSFANFVSRPSIYLAAAFESPVMMLPQFPWQSTSRFFCPIWTSAPRMDESPWGCSFMASPTIVATLVNVPSSILYMVCRTRRWTGFSPSSICGTALWRMTYEE